MQSVAECVAEHFVLPDELVHALDEWLEILPTDLLRAALLPEEAALGAYLRVKGELEPKNPGHRQLLPKLHQNLIGQLPDDEFLHRIQTIRKSVFAQNRVQSIYLEKLLRHFDTFDIPVILLKGSAIAPLYYPDVGCRPVGDFDILVHETDFSRAQAMLQEVGWTGLVETDSGAPYIGTLFTHATELALPGTLASLDLHCHISQYTMRPGVDIDCWDKAVPIEVRAVRVLRLSDTDNLLHACWHGMTHPEQPPVRWVADAYLILDHSGAAIDWERLVESAEKTQTAPIVFAALMYLQRTLGCEIPDVALRALQDGTLSPVMMEKWYCHIEPDFSIRRSARFMVRFLWCRFRVPVGNVSLMRQLACVPEFLRTEAKHAGLIGALSVLASRFWKNVVKSHSADDAAIQPIAKTVR